jgi:radical SAM protein with 4Fe4S-binding SPASM domain
MQELKQRLGKVFPIVRVQVVDSPSTHAQLDEYFDFWGKTADDLGVECVNDWHYKSLGKVVVCSDFECAMLYQRLIIGWDGRVFICCGNHFGKLIAGDLNKQTIEEVWNGDVYKRLRKLSELGLLHKSRICAECGYRMTVIKNNGFSYAIEDAGYEI